MLVNYLSKRRNRSVRMRVVIVSVIFFSAAMLRTPSAQSQSIVMGYSGSGLSTDLRRVIEKEKLWDKYGLNVKSIYFNSGSVLTQAMAGGNINASDSDVPAMLNLSVSGVLDVKAIAVTINRLEHIFVVRKNITKPEELKPLNRQVSWTPAL